MDGGCYSDLETGAPDTACTLDDVGKDWLEIQESCYHCALDYQYFTTAGTPGVHSAPVDPNLDRPTLTRRICPPLTLPRDPRYDGSAVHSPLVFDGPYAVAYQRNGQALLEKCHTHIRQTLGSIRGLVRTPHALLWTALDPRSGIPQGVAGVFLPSRQKFVIHLPQKLADLGIRLTGATTRCIYITTTLTAATWAATLPTPPANRHQRRT